MADETIHIVEQPGSGAGQSAAAEPVKSAEPAGTATEPVRITVRPNGPLRVEGHIVLQDADGRTWDLAGKPAVSLCRCGLSEKRPFCDGSHNRQGWQCNASPALLT